MTVGELIAVLQQHDPSVEVLINGYEGGLQAPHIYRTGYWIDGCEGEAYSGPHREVATWEWFDNEDLDSYGAPEECLLLSRNEG